MTITGTLTYQNLEGGIWVFKTDDGGQFSLDGLNSTFLVDGARLELTGEKEAMFGFAMVGETFKVKSAKKL